MIGENLGVSYYPIKQLHLDLNISKVDEEYETYNDYDDDSYSTDVDTTAVSLGVGVRF